MESQCLADIDDYFSNNNIMQSPVLRLTYTASSVGLRLPQHWEVTLVSWQWRLGLDTLHYSLTFYTKK